MTDEREELLKDVFAAWSRGDFEASLKAFDPDVSWQLSGVFPDTYGSLHGLDELREFWRDFSEPWEKIELEPLRFHHEGEWIVTELRFCALAANGARVELELAQACLFRGAHAAEVRGFRDLDEALTMVRGRSLRE